MFTAFWLRASIGGGTLLAQAAIQRIWPFAELTDNRVPQGRGVQVLRAGLEQENGVHGCYFESALWGGTE